VTPPVNDPVTSIDPAYEAVLRKMVGDLEQAPDAHERWAAANALQGQADSAIGELLDTVTVLRAERDAAMRDAEFWRQLREHARAQDAPRGLMHDGDLVSVISSLMTATAHRNKVARAENDAAERHGATR
jgi:hypothetical protein